MDEIRIGDFDSLNSYSGWLELDNYAIVQGLSINSATLGELASADIRLDFVRAIFDIAECLSVVAPPTSVLIKILD